jgi:hypothetical protein
LTQPPNTIILMVYIIHYGLVTLWVYGCQGLLRKSGQHPTPGRESQFESFQMSKSSHSGQSLFFLQTQIPIQVSLDLNSFHLFRGCECLECVVLAPWNVCACLKSFQINNPHISQLNASPAFSASLAISFLISSSSRIQSFSELLDRPMGRVTVQLSRPVGCINIQHSNDKGKNLTALTRETRPPFTLKYPPLSVRNLHQDKTLTVNRPTPLSCLQHGFVNVALLSDSSAILLTKSPQVNHGRFLFDCCNINC